MGSLMLSIADFIPELQNWVREFSHNNQEMMQLVNQLQFDPDQAIKWGIGILGNGAGNMMNTTVSAVGIDCEWINNLFYRLFVCLLYPF